MKTVIFKHPPPIEEEGYIALHMSVSMYVSHTLCNW